MTATLINTDNVDDLDLAALQLDGTFSLATAIVGGTTYLFAAGHDDNGVSVFSVTTNGMLTNVDNVSDDGTLELGGAISATTAVVSGTTYLFVVAEFDSGVSVFSVDAAGQLTNVENVNDDATLQLSGAASVATSVVGGTTYLYVAGLDDNGVSVFSVDAAGQLTNVENVTDNGTLAINRPVAVTTAVIGGTTYLFVAGINDDGISVFSVATDGMLTNVANVTDNGTLELDNPRGLVTADVGGTTFLFATGETDNGVSVFSVDAAGQLTNVDNVDDASIASLQLNGAFGVSAATVGGTTHLFVTGGGDDGISVFSVDVAGQLTNIFNINDTSLPGLELDGPVSVANETVGGVPFLLAGSLLDDGISAFAISNPPDDFILGTPGPDSLIGGAGNDTIFGEGGNDILEGGDDDDTLDGGEGVDTADFSADTSGVDLNLNSSLAQDAGDLGMDTLSGIENLTGGSGNDRLVGTGTAQGANTLSGNDGNDVLVGLGGNDILQGGAGNDNLLGGAAMDTLFGGAGDDQLRGGDGNDVLQGNVGRDILFGQSGSDVFALNDTSDSGLVFANRDIIRDFQQGADTIDLSTIDADTNTAGTDESFTFIGSTVLTGAAGELQTFILAGGQTIVRGDVDGDGTQDFSFVIDGAFNLVNADFVL